MLGQRRLLRYQRVIDLLPHSVVTYRSRGTYCIRICRRFSEKNEISILFEITYIDYMRDSIILGTISDDIFLDI